ncbi:SNF1-related protein kinase regulatory subunit gamma-1-like protein [Trifolium pratense]|uniref:SNF1-related protein kinase regulatory subunit gamma-1-like protein n=1 Tax=Trifolium pratense TaxID=57577 RepID=A0A2K3NMJ7_TRIPR|nr:SNF1-related protein kinase regulatory subunit gamma-1-like protein [Trifolium pratense]
MQSRKIKDCGLVAERKEEDNDDRRVQLDSGSALQQCLDHKSIKSISGINNSLVLEIKAGNTIRDAIQMLYEKDTFGAVIVDVLDTETDDIRHSDRYIGFIAFPNIVLWCLDEYENIREDATDSHLKDVENDGFFSILAKPKVGELAKSFLWEPFLPVPFLPVYIYLSISCKFCLSYNNLMLHSLVSLHRKFQPEKQLNTENGFTGNQQEKRYTEASNGAYDRD